MISIRSHLSLLRLLLSLFVTVPVAAQTLYVPSGTSGIGSSATGNVGIGVGSPGYSLHSTGDIGVESDKKFVARYTGNETYKATFGWSHLQLGNNGPNWIVAGRTATGGSLAFIVNNTADYSYGGYDGILAMSIAANGNVGIGTTSSAIAGGFTSKLQVSGAYAAIAIEGTAAAKKWGIGVDSNGALDIFDSTASYSGRLLITNVGNVGVGIANPQTRLHADTSSYNAEGIRSSYGGNSHSAGLGVEAYGSHWGAGIFQDGTMIGNFENGGLSVGQGYVQQNVPSNGLIVQGNVGIGTTSPTQKLSVNGTIQAKEVVVQTGWSDYVFAKGYRLAPLSEVEQHIEQQGHLPGIPSAKDVAERGVSIGEMQSKLLAKIEELTLHVIAQEKRAIAQQNEIAALRSQVGAGYRQ